jgi:tripartite-type tricarboxylate transporter receptor subunit TctC
MNFQSETARRWLLAAALVAAANVALAQSSSTGSGQAYPLKPAKIVVPFAAGGVADITARVLAQKMSETMGQQVLVENRPSAGGIIASEAVARADPDGYTLLFITNGNAVSASLFKSLPYDTVNDFAPVSTVGFFDLVVLVNGDSKLRSLAELIQFAKANPGKLNIGTINPGSTQNLAAELFRSTAGIEVTIVPFRTSPDMTGAILRGDVDLAFEFYAAIQGQVVDHKMRVLASTGPKRTTYLSDVPTAQEGGIKDYEVVSWNGISVPAATPKPIIDAISRAINEVLPLPDVQEKSQRLGMDMRASTPEEMTARMKSDIAKWGAVIEKAGIPKRD